MVSKNYTNIPSQTFLERSYCSAAICRVSFCLLSSWHGCRLQSTVGIVSRTGTAVAYPSPWAANQKPQLFSTSGWRMQHGDARRPGNTGYHSRIALIIYIFDGPEPRCSPFLALLTLQKPPVKCSSRFQGSLLTPSVHFIPPFSWNLLLADGDSGLKQRLLLCESCHAPSAPAASFQLNLFWCHLLPERWGVMEKTVKLSICFLVWFFFLILFP